MFDNHSLILWTTVFVSPGQLEPHQGNFKIYTLFAQCQYSPCSVCLYVYSFCNSQVKDLLVLAKETAKDRNGDVLLSTILRCYTISCTAAGISLTLHLSNQKWPENFSKPLCEFESFSPISLFPFFWNEVSVPKPSNDFTQIFPFESLKLMI